MKKNNFNSKIFLLLLFFSANLSADTLILSTGEYFKGKTISQNAKEIVFQKEDGVKYPYSKALVLRVFYRDLNENEVQEVIIKENKNLDPSKIIKARQGNLKDDSYKGNRWSPVWRSAIIPGWGQWYGGQKILGISIGILFFASAGYLGSSFQEMNSNLQKKETADRNGNLAIFLIQPTLNSLPQLYLTNQILGIQSQNAEKDYQASVGQVVIAIGAVATIYTLQIFHSLYLGRKLVSEQEKRLKAKEQTGFNFDTKFERIQSFDNSELNTLAMFEYKTRF